MVIHSCKQERQKYAVVGIYIPRVGLTKEKIQCCSRTFLYRLGVLAHSIIAFDGGFS